MKENICFLDVENLVAVINKCDLTVLQTDVRIKAYDLMELLDGKLKLFVKGRNDIVKKFNPEDDEQFHITNPEKNKQAQLEIHKLQTTPFEIEFDKNYIPKDEFVKILKDLKPFEELALYKLLCEK